MPTITRETGERGMWRRARLVMGEGKSRKAQGKSEVREGQARERTTCGEQSQGKNKRQIVGYLLHSPANCNTRNWQEVEKKATGEGKLDEMITTVFAAGWQNCEITSTEEEKVEEKIPTIFATG
ncbi:hypothetical protein TNCT_187651 [Trichonephila clavata]|uniref:Uncharacterized protein n=1 Tax=Trichonephila clavata TaxID=2740835 RepID=A0A8X6KJC9_TRICU|nr:hypothetical protein TNCT_187651 [Trichonephila clavata]